MSTAQIHARSIADCARDDSGQEFAKNVRALLRAAERSRFAVSVWHEDGKTFVVVHECKRNSDEYASALLSDKARALYDKLVSASCAPLVGARLTRGGK